MVTRPAIGVIGGSTIVFRSFLLRARATGAAELSSCLVIVKTDDVPTFYTTAAGPSFLADAGIHVNVVDGVLGIAWKENRSNDCTSISHSETVRSLKQMRSFKEISILEEK